VRFVEHKVALGQVSHRVLLISHVSMSPVVLHTHVYVQPLHAGQMGQAWEPSKMECTFINRGAFDRELFDLVLKG
jgi:hypothetical protein